MTQGKKTSSAEIAKNLKETGGNISATARRMKVSRDTIHTRMNQEPELKRLTDAERQGMVDLAEQGLKTILQDYSNKDHFNAVKYALSTIGKGRGYTEKQEVEVSGMTVIVRSEDCDL